MVLLHDIIPIFNLADFDGGAVFRIVALDEALSTYCTLP
jgi:hypothetical protein